MGLTDSDVSFVGCSGVMVLFLKSSHILSIKELYVSPPVFGIHNLVN